MPSPFHIGAERKIFMYDPFFRADNFKEEPWYSEFLIFTRIGVCTPQPEHLEAVKAALHQMGYEALMEFTRNGKVYLAGGEGGN